MDTYKKSEQALLDAIADSDGNDNLVIYVKDIRKVRVLPPNLNVIADEQLTARLKEIFGSENVKIVF